MTAGGADGRCSSAARRTAEHTLGAECVLAAHFPPDAVGHAATQLELLGRQ